jgi:hypothetical protein
LKAHRFEPRKRRAEIAAGFASGFAAGFAEGTWGYAGAMSSSEDLTTPPGGPQRQDAPGEGLDHHDTGVDSESKASDEDEHGGTIPIEDEESHPTPEREEDALERENAESSEEQPSEG